MIEMQDHIAVITGAGSGFGEATALRLAREGMPIFCQDINEENAQRTANKVREGNGRAEAIGGDVSNEADVKAMFAACRNAFGDCTLLFANAGYARLSPFVEMKTEDSIAWWRCFCAASSSATARRSARCWRRVRA